MARACVSKDGPGGLGWETGPRDHVFCLALLGGDGVSGARFGEREAGSCLCTDEPGTQAGVAMTEDDATVRAGGGASSADASDGDFAGPEGLTGAAVAAFSGWTGGLDMRRTSGAQWESVGGSDACLSAGDRRAAAARTLVLQWLGLGARSGPLLYRFGDRESICDRVVKSGTEQKTAQMRHGREGGVCRWRCDC